MHTRIGVIARIGGRSHATDKKRREREREREKGDERRELSAAEDLLSLLNY